MLCRKVGRNVPKELALTALDFECSYFAFFISFCHGEQAPKKLIFWCEMERNKWIFGRGRTAS